MAVNKVYKANMENLLKGRSKLKTVPVKPDDLEGNRTEQYRRRLRTRGKRQLSD